MRNLGIVTSGLLIAQKGLYTTGHNITNAATDGYTRQRLNQADAPSFLLGGYGSGSLKLQLGLGVDTQSVTQIRSEFLDKAYRAAVSKAGFHQVKIEVTSEIENMMSELYGSAKLSTSIQDMWRALQELTTHPDGIETRAMFIQSAQTFATKANEIGNGLKDYQEKLNIQIIDMVNRINQITTQVEDLNRKIQLQESAGDHANDLRDTRNLLIDELSRYGDIYVTEDPTNRINILFEGHDLVSNGTAHLLGLQYEQGRTGLVKPVFDRDYAITGKIIDNVDSLGNPIFKRELYPGLTTAKIGGKADNDNGSLKALLLARGPMAADYTTNADAVKNFTIPKFQRELDILINKVVTLINDTLAPKNHVAADAPMGLPQGTGDGNQFIELFSRKGTPRYTETPAGSGNFVYNDEFPAAEYDSSGKLTVSRIPGTLYTMGNLEINIDVANNYSNLCFSPEPSHDRGDSAIIQDLLDAWMGKSGDQYLPATDAASKPLGFMDYYSHIITNLGEEGKTSAEFVKAQEQIVIQTNNFKQQLSGVALDEELVSMMKYQHAYNGAAQMISVIDGMLDIIVNRLKA